MRMSPLKEAKNLDCEFFWSLYKDSVFVLNLNIYLQHYSSFELEKTLITQKMLPGYYKSV